MLHILHRSTIRHVSTIGHLGASQVAVETEGNTRDEDAHVRIYVSSRFRADHTPTRKQNAPPLAPAADTPAGFMADRQHTDNPLLVLTRICHQTVFRFSAPGKSSR
jgi:hypothetical protein